MKQLIIILILIILKSYLNAQSLSSNDTIIRNIKSQFKIMEFDLLQNIDWFNNDTILVSGYISDNLSDAKYKEKKNLIYQSFDKGKSWNRIYFNGDAWIYDTYWFKNGQIWIGGSDEIIYFSNDYGTTWTEKGYPFKPSNRVYKIYMLDSLTGIAGGLHNGLAITNDNWKNTIQIPTPLDQKRYTILQNSSRNRIDKVEMIDSLILINQNDHIYYSKLNPIEWKPFCIPIVDFEIDKINGQILLISLQGKTFVLDKDLNLKSSYTQYIFRFAKQIKRDSINLDNFFCNDKIKIKIIGIEYIAENQSGGCMQYTNYKKNTTKYKVKQDEKINEFIEIIKSSNLYNSPNLNKISFCIDDYDKYYAFLTEIINKRKEEKIWGGDFTSLLDLSNNYFQKPENVIKNLNNCVLDTVISNEYFPEQIEGFPLFENNNSYIEIVLISSSSDTLKITSKNSIIYCLPYTFEFKGKQFETYDTRITEFLRNSLPKDFNFYDKLFAGELIYKLIVQNIINEIEYKKCP
jgi:hypothetical protein